MAIRWFTLPLIAGLCGAGALEARRWMSFDAPG